MIETYYLCFDNKALAYAQRHFENRFTKVVRCFTNAEVYRTIRFMNANNKKTFFIFRSAEHGFLRSEIKNIEILSGLVVKAAKRLRLAQ